MRCENIVMGTYCDGEAAAEFFRHGAKRWRRVCGECLDVVRKHAVPGDQLRIRPIESGDDDFAHHQRCAKLYGKGNDRE